MIHFGRDITGRSEAHRREWLVTNGIGGFASGTISDLLTRRYHGLLVAALNPPLGRTVLLSRIEASLEYDGRPYPLFANQWQSDESPIKPKGHLSIESFRLEGAIPTWAYVCGDALVERRIWMEQGANTTYIQYRMCRGSAPLKLHVKMLTNYRDMHHLPQTTDTPMEIEAVSSGLKVTAHESAVPYYLRSENAQAVAQHIWYRDYYHAVEDFRGLLPVVGDNLFAGFFAASLTPGESVTFVASTSPDASIDGDAALKRRRDYEARLYQMADLPDTSPDWIRQLVLAANQFIVRRATDIDPDGRTILAGYHWFSDWGRDTMIALPGLTLATGRVDVAKSILRTFARFVDQGMLPNRFPDTDETPEYNTVDATLWYFEAIRATVEATDDHDLLRDLFPVLQDIIEWHRNGTRYGIQVDDSDGLLRAGETGVQLTWMDAKVGGDVITPRIGKPVEINALWYNALRSMADFATTLGEDAAPYADLADQVKSNFQRFWDDYSGHCYDVIDGPEGADPTLRPNQLFAVSLHHSPLPPDQQQAVVDICARKLVTSMGLRSLSPDDGNYAGTYGGDAKARDSVYHQGPVWAWLIGAFVSATYRVHGDAEVARSFLAPFEQHLADYGIGSIAEIAEGDPPHQPRACIAQAWSVAEVLRAWRLLEEE